MEKIIFRNSLGQKIVGLLSDPGSDKVVIICHGLGSHKDDSPYNKFEKHINALGIATFRMDFLGHGESDGNYEDLTLSEATDDILCARKILKRFRSIGFIGSSMGAVSGIMAGAKVRFNFMIFISPPSHYSASDILFSGYHVMKELRKFHKKQKKLNDKKAAGLRVKFFWDYTFQDSYEAAEKIFCPTLIIHGDNDKIVPLAKSRELRKKLRNSKMKIFKGADHRFTHPAAQKKLIEEVVKFVENH